MSNQFVKFDLFRYQILPINRNYQGDLYLGTTVEKLLAHKNRLFAEALVQAILVSPTHGRTVVKLEASENDFFLLRVAVSRSLRRESKDFRQELVDHWPSVLVGVWNQPDRQTVAVQRRAKEFKNPGSIMRWLARALRAYLKHFQLSVAWEPIFDKHDFWALVQNYRTRVTEVEFELVTPNMASISRALNADLKEFAKQTNAIKSKLKITADPAAVLDLRPDNRTLQGLVDYTSQGGGNIKLRLAGLARTINTADQPKSLQIAELELEGQPEAVLKVLKDVMR